MVKQRPQLPWRGREVFLQCSTPSLTMRAWYSPNIAASNIMMAQDCRELEGPSASPYNTI